MEPHTVIVEVVQHGDTALVSLPVVRLRPVGAASVGPVDVVEPAARGPPDVSPAGGGAASPEVLLSIIGHQPEELALLGAAVDGDRPHTVVPAKALALPLGEAGAADAPGDEVVLVLEAMVGSVAATAPPAVPLVPLSLVPLAPVLPPTTKQLTDTTKQAAELRRRSSE